MTPEYTAVLDGTGRPEGDFRKFVRREDGRYAHRLSAAEAVSLVRSPLPGGLVLLPLIADPTGLSGYYSPGWMTVRSLLREACRGASPWEDSPPLFRLWSAWDQPWLVDFVVEGASLLLEPGGPDGGLSLVWPVSNPISAHRASFLMPPGEPPVLEVGAWRNRLAAEAGVRELNVTAGTPGRTRWEDPESHLDRHPTQDNRCPLVAVPSGLDPSYWARLGETPARTFIGLVWESLDAGPRAAVEALLEKCFVQDREDGYFDKELLTRRAAAWLLLPILLQAEPVGVRPHPLADYALAAFAAWASAPAADWLAVVGIGDWLRWFTEDASWYEVRGVNGRLTVNVRADAPVRWKLLLHVLIPTTRIRGQFIVETSLLNGEDRLGSVC